MSDAAWADSLLGDIVTLNYGSSLPERDRRAGTVPVYGSNGVVGWHDQPTVDAPGVVVGRKGSAGRVHQSQGPFCPIDTTFFATADDTTLDLRFLYFLLLFLDLKDIVGDVGVPGLNREAAYRQRVRVPIDRALQEQIAWILSEVEDVMRRQTHALSVLKDLKQGLLHELFRLGGGDASDPETAVSAIPASWKTSSVGGVARLRSGGTPSRKQPEYWADGTIPWVKTAEVDNGVINQTGEHISPAGLENSSAKLFPAGTLVMAMYGQGVTRGKVALLGIEATTNQACLAFFPNDEISPEYLYYAFQARYDELRELGHGANQKNLSAEIVRAMEIAFPIDSSAQDEAVAVLKEVDLKLTLERRALSLVTELFGSLLGELMTGKIAPPVRITKMEPAA